MFAIVLIIAIIIIFTMIIKYKKCNRKDIINVNIKSKKLEVGDYVRNNKGIAKYLGVGKEEIFDKEYLIYLFDRRIFDNWNSFNVDKINEYIFKSSSNIINLIEEEEEVKEMTLEQVIKELGYEIKIVK